MKNLRFLSLYFFIPKRINYPLKNVPDKKLYWYIKTGKGKKEVEEIIKNSKALLLFLNLIAKKNKKNPFDKEVIEAYFIGNELLKAITAKDIKDMIKNDFTKIGLSKETAHQLIEKLPTNAIPYYNFHLLHASLLSSNIPMLYEIDNSKISCGKVKKILVDKLIVEYSPLIRKQKLCFGKTKQKKIYYDKDIVKNIKKDDYVSIHWDFALEKITKTQAKNLDVFTRKTVREINKFL